VVVNTESSGNIIQRMKKDLVAAALDVRHRRTRQPDGCSETLLSDCRSFSRFLNSAPRLGVKCCRGFGASHPGMIYRLKHRSMSRPVNSLLSNHKLMQREIDNNPRLGYAEGKLRVTNTSSAISEVSTWERAGKGVTNPVSAAYIW
jgi:hypothetical protein